MARNLTQDEIEAFKARLCAVAERRFAEGGVASVSMRQLAEELGCSPMTPYRYFKDKEDILAAVRTAAFDRFAAALEAAGASAGEPRERAHAVGEAYLAFAFAEPNAYRLMFDMTQPGDDRYPELERAGSRARRTMSAHLETMVERGLIHGDPQVLSYVIWASIHGLVMLRLAGKLPDGPGFRVIHAEMMRLLVQGMRAPMPETGIESE
ncbi:MULTISPECIES: TetR/AcrR family transcriptional regulator [Cupriavidus]|jgi:AcrR family transcriptional regulator|uniref:TetR/AcrR family transcriptional regulator n=1 Tax=Cupriavidus TaxID=106589 RepID=UPI0004521F65|nr:MULTISPECIES: TetR/AcrR family transcriptional regulator [Cupriavidus]KDP86730.1 TetR family transcriptional regulator [Cupriavidus sp. SK-3]MDF3882511.1 TetR/AcrR family transcriptional regulator [Cupriavidus basilensis]